MLVDYEYELLSYIVNKSISKSDDIIFVSFSNIREIDPNIQLYLEKLKDSEIVEINVNGIDIYVNKWIDFFSTLLNNEFIKYNMQIECYYDTKCHCLMFNINESIKKFNIVIKKESRVYKDDTIFMCKFNLSIGDIFWMDLLNDSNKLQMFYLYLLNEINRINMGIYKDINIFEGIEDTHLSEIFNVSIKEYFKQKGKIIDEVSHEVKLIVRDIIKKDEINCYSVNLGETTLIIIKDTRIIKFVTIKNDIIVYSKEVDDEILDIKEKLIEKVSEYRKLNMFRDNNIIENSNKLSEGSMKFFLPFMIAINILVNMGGLTNFVSMYLIKGVKIFSYILVLILLYIQFKIVSLIYVPAYRLSKFKWDIKH